MSNRILLIEDDEDNRLLIETYLTLEGYDVTSTSNAAEAIRLNDAELFGVYILDKRLPDQSGIDLCRYICRLDPSAIVVFFSAAAYLSDKEQGLKAGAKEYLIKPNDFHRLPHVLTRLLKQTLSTRPQVCSSIRVNHPERGKQI